MPAYFHRMVGAEMLKIITRVSGWAGLFLSALIPLLVTCMLVWMQPEAVDPNAAPDMNAAMMQSMIPDQAFTVLDWTLTGRNILIMPMVLLLITAQLFAGEWSERTLRSLLLRPVSRASVLMAKFSALWIYAGACLLVSYLFALAGGWIFLGHEAEIIGVTKGFAVCWLRDGALLASMRDGGVVEVVDCTVYPVASHPPSPSKSWFAMVLGLLLSMTHHGPPTPAAFPLQSLS